MMSDRCFYVTHQGKSSKWKRQKNGLAQGGVLSPILFNIYTNDQPIGEETEHFLYADDLVATAQGDNHAEVQEKLQRILDELDIYYSENALKPNPAKTQVCSFHLKNAKAKCKLQLNWGGTPLEHCDNPKYLGITLDRSLTFKKHCEDTKLKVEARNNILRKLVSSRWGARPSTLRTTALALCYSTAEYGCPAWGGSAHAKKIDVALNNTMRIISGCLKPTNVKYLPRICGIAPPGVRREVAADAERARMELDPRHVMHGQTAITSRLKSRRGFLKQTTPLTGDPSDARIARWSERAGTQCNEDLASGCSLGYQEWTTLNRLRTDCARTGSNMKKWGLQDNDNCPRCGEIQTHSHLFECGDITCTRADLWKELDEAATGVILRWRGVI